VLTPLIRDCQSPDLLIVQINPQQRLGTPRSSQQIIDRLNEITFNASLVRDIDLIRFVNQHLRSGVLKGEGFREIFLHRIGGGAVAETWTAASKMSASWELLQLLFEEGRAEAETWLTASFADLGVRDSMPDKI
jgi:NTE family protein